MRITPTRRVLSLDAFFQMPAIPEESGETNAETHTRLKRALRLAVGDILTDRQRECLELYYYQGYSMKQVADMLQIGEPTVSKHLKKARSRLRSVLRYSFPLR